MKTFDFDIKYKIIKEKDSTSFIPIIKFKTFKKKEGRIIDNFMKTLKSTKSKGEEVK